MHDHAVGARILYLGRELEYEGKLVGIRNGEAEGDLLAGCGRQAGKLCSTIFSESLT